MPGKHHLKAWAGAAAELLFPPRCCHCRRAAGRVESGLCRNCLDDIPYVRSPLCPVCGRNFLSPRQSDHICGRCLHNPPPFSMARAIAFYEEPVRSLLHNLKYAYDTSAVQPLLKIAQSFDFSPFESCELFLPVPLHPGRLRQRGMNQALVLARLFFPDRREDIAPLLLRKIYGTRSQAGLGAAERKHNLKNAFSVEHPENIRNKKVCLIDDIYTTGATARECAEVLIRSGAAEVLVLTYARVREWRP